MTTIPLRSRLAASSWWAATVAIVVALVIVALLLAVVSRGTESDFLAGSGSFETSDMAGWTTHVGTSVAVDDAVDGARVMRVSGNGAAAYPGAISSPLKDVGPGSVVRLTASARRVSGSSNANCRADTMRDGAVAKANAALVRFTSSGAFVTATSSFTMPADRSIDAVRVLCYIGSSAAGATETWDFDAVNLVGLAASDIQFSQDAAMGFVAIVAAWAVLFGVLVIRLRHRPSIVIAALCLWFAVQNVIAALAAPQSPAWVVVSIVVAKEILYVALFVIGTAFVVRAAIRRRMSIRQLLERLELVDWLAVAFIVLVGIAFLVSGESMTSRLINARRLASLPVLYLAGRTLLASRSEFTGAIRMLVGIAVAVSILGFVELFVLGDAFWRETARILELQGDTITGGIQSALQHARDGLPLNWWTHLIVRFRRLVSTFLEPTTLSIFLALIVTLAPIVLVRRRGPSVVIRHRGGRLVAPRAMLGDMRGYLARWDAPAAAAMAVLLVAMALTFGKGGWMIVATAAFTCVLSTTRRTVGWLVAVVAVVALIALAIGSRLPGVGPNIGAHVDGLITGAVQVLTHPLGSGLGSTGFWGTNLDVGTDSTAGVIASQLGLPGIVLFVAWAALLIYRVLPAGSDEDLRRRRPDPALRRALAGATLGLFGLALLSTSATGLLGSAFYLLLGGWMISLATRDRWPRGRRVGANVAAGATSEVVDIPMAGQA